MYNKNTIEEIFKRMRPHTTTIDDVDNIGDSIDSCTDQYDDCSLSSINKEEFYKLSEVAKFDILDCGKDGEYSKDVYVILRGIITINDVSINTNILKLKLGYYYQDMVEDMISILKAENIRVGYESIVEKILKVCNLTYTVHDDLDD